MEEKRIQLAGRGQDKFGGEDIARSNEHGVKRVMFRKERTQREERRRLSRGNETRLGEGMDSLERSVNGVKSVDIMERSESGRRRRGYGW